MKKYIYTIVTMVTMLISASAYAQQDTTAVGNTTVQAIFAQGSDRGCWHPEIKDGVCRKHLCNGWQLSAGVKVAMVNWSSELGSGNSFAPAPTVTVGYRQGHWQPEVSFAYLIGVEVENLKLNSPELTLSVRYNFNKHDHKGGLRAYVAPTATYRDMKSVDFIDLGPEWEVFKNPFHGHYFAVGGKVGFDVNLGEIVKHRSTTVGNNNFLLDIVGHSVLSVEAGYDYGQINKLRKGVTNTSLKLHTGYIKVSYTVDLP